MYWATNHHCRPDWWINLFRKSEIYKGNQFRYVVAKTQRHFYPCRRPFCLCVGRQIMMAVISVSKSMCLFEERGETWVQFYGPLLKNINHSVYPQIRKTIYLKAFLSSVISCELKYNTHAGGWIKQHITWKLKYMKGSVQPSHKHICIYLFLWFTGEIIVCSSTHLHLDIQEILIANFAYF